MTAPALTPSNPRRRLWVALAVIVAATLGSLRNWRANSTRGITRRTLDTALRQAREAEKQVRTGRVSGAANTRRVTA